MRPGRILATATAALAVALAGACARQGAPPGGPQDRRPPVVVLTVPDTFAVDSTFRGPARFDFDERISERVGNGTLDNAVVVSPRTGEVRVSHSRAGIKVDMAGGFKPGLVYRITLLPVFADMFNNRMRDPFDLIFSTGAPFVNSAVVGMVWDRVTGAPMPDMSVMAVPEGDSTRYFARSDTTGIYAFRYLPPARYRLTAFEDRNRNYRLDRNEPRGEQSVLFAGADTLLPLNIAALQPDTGHARVRLAEALDSLTVVVTFDRFIDPQEPTQQISASLAREDSAAPRVVRVYKEREYSDWVEQVRDSAARVDSLAAAARARDTAAEDTTAGKPAVADSGAAKPLLADTAAKPAAAPAPPPRPPRYLPPRLPGAGGAPGRGVPSRGPATGRAAGLDPDGEPLPAQRIVLVLDTLLVPNVDYLLTVQGVTTVNGIPLGGGEAHVIRQPPKDTTKAVEDTSVVKDTAVVRDTLSPDTLLAPPDTSGHGRPGPLPHPFAALPARSPRPSGKR